MKTILRAAAFPLLCSIVALVGVGAVTWWICESSGVRHRWVIVMYVINGAAVVGSILLGTAVFRPLFGKSRLKANLGTLGQHGWLLASALLEVTGGDIEAVKGQLAQVRSDYARVKEENAETLDEVLAAVMVPVGQGVTALFLALAGTLIGIAASVLWAAGRA